MGTRSADLDPGVRAFVARTLGLDPAQIRKTALYHDSGLKALSGIGADLREIEARARQGACQRHRRCRFTPTGCASTSGPTPRQWAAATPSPSPAGGRTLPRCAGASWRACSSSACVSTDHQRSPSARPVPRSPNCGHRAHPEVAVLAVALAREQWVIARETAAVLPRTERAAAVQDFSMPVAISGHHVHLHAGRRQRGLVRHRPRAARVAAAPASPASSPPRKRFP